MSGSNKTIPEHEASQSGHGDVRRIVGHASSLNHDGEGETGLRDGSAAIDGRTEKTHATERVESTPLKIELIPLPGSHGKSNSSVIEVIILRILGRVRRVCD